MENEVTKLTQTKAAFIDREDPESPGRLTIVTFRGWVRAIGDGPKRQRILAFETEAGRLVYAWPRRDHKTGRLELWIDNLYDVNKRQRLDALRMERDEAYARIKAIDNEIASMRVQVDPYDQPLEPSENFKKRWAQSLERSKEVLAQKRSYRQAKKNKADRAVSDRAVAKGVIKTRTLVRRPKFPADKFDQVWDLAIACLEGHRLDTSKANLLKAMPDGLESWQGKIRGSSTLMWVRIERALRDAENGEPIEKY